MSVLEQYRTMAYVVGLIGSIGLVVYIVMLPA